MQNILSLKCLTDGSRGIDCLYDRAVSPDSKERPESTARARRVTRRRVATVLAGLAGTAALLHAANLLFLADRYGCNPVNFACRAGHDPFVAPDTAGYLQAMTELRERGLFGASMLKRPAFSWASWFLRPPVTW